MKLPALFTGAILLAAAGSASAIESIEQAANQLDLGSLQLHAESEPAGYRTAFANYRYAITASVLGERDEAADALQRSRDTLETMLEERPCAESMALLAGVLGMQIGNNPLRGMRYGPRIGRLLSDAEALEPENPRVQLIAAISAYHTPAMFGGSKSRAIELTSQAIELYQQPCGDICWGEAEAYAWRGLARMELGRDEDAFQDWNDALRISPDYSWPQFLLAQHGR